MSKEFNQAQHRYLDGEPVEGLTDEERARVGGFGRALAEYAQGLALPGTSVDRAVMERIRGRADRRAPSVWRWFLEPRPIRVRPVVAFAALALVFGAGFWFWPAPSPPSPGAVTATVVTTDGPGSVLVRFELRAPSASRVALAGSFNGWDAPGIPLIRAGESDLWTVTVPLAVGEHQYGFVVDDDIWMSDPAAHAQVDDGFGQTNSVLVVSPRGVVRS